MPIASVTGLQAALDAAPDNLRELTDTAISGLTDGDYLQYDSASGKWQNSSLILGRSGEQYTGNYDTEAGTLRSGATETVELYYTAQADGDGLSESASSDTPSAGNVIRRKLWYAEKAQADPDTSGDWTQFAEIADDTAYATAKATLLAYLKARTGGTVPISLKMTWEDVAATSYLLDTYTGAAAAYSLRKLRTAYTGDAVEVYNGSSYADIGFDGSGELDTTALASHCGSNDGFVSKWYDQSGNSNDATQAATGQMPKIYDGATTGVVTEGSAGNEKPAVEFDGSDDGLVGSTDLNTTVANTAVFTTYTIDASASGTVWSLQQFASAGIRGQQNTSTNYRLEIKDPLGNVTIQTGDSVGQKIKSHIFAPNSQDIYTNGTNVTSRTESYSDYDLYLPKIGLRNNDSYFLGKVQELIVYTSDQSSNRTNIEDNINTFYSIY